MLARIRRLMPHGGALSVVLGIVVLASADGPFGGITIVAPISVLAGAPINGFVTDIVPPVNISCAEDNGPDLPGSPTSGNSDPTAFCFQTTEIMAGSTVTIYASDAAPNTASANVFIQ